MMTAPHVVARTSSNNGGTSMARRHTPTVLSFIMDFCLVLCATFEKFNRVRLLRQSNINFCPFFMGFFTDTMSDNKINETLKREEG